MGLSLSTSAVPELSLEAFETECRGRGLDGMELVLPRGASLEALLDEAKEAGARILALRAEAIDRESAPALARAARSLGVPVSVPAGAEVLGELGALAPIFEREDAKLLLARGSDLEGMVELCAAIRIADGGTSLGVAWEVMPSSEKLDDASAVLFTAREFLGLVRLHGGGPEQRDQDGLGVGQVLVDLALSQFQGPIVLQPSSSEALPRWAKWLSSRRSAGCGTKAEAELLELDVRDVEPRDRLGTILGAYASLGRGKTMKLTVDHDPSCMYYTLQANEPEGSFSFQTLEHGPEVWKAEVTKL